ncbi:MAG: hypothetical protein Kow0056_15090 [Coriobacteriia bacterium]
MASRFRRRKGLALALSMILATAMTLAMTPIAAMGHWAALSSPEMASVSSGGTPGDDWSGRPRFSDDGRWVVFVSHADNLAPGTNSRKNVFLRDMVSGETTLVSDGSDDRGSRLSDISDDGRYVSFFSGQSFVATDTNGDQDIYIWDRITDTYHYADVSGDGTSPGDNVWQARLSGNGRFVVFDTDHSVVASDTNGKRDVYLWDSVEATTTWVSAPTSATTIFSRGSRDPVISDDGGYVAFFSGKDFVASDTNGDQDLYIWDRATGQYQRADLTGDGSSPGDDLWDFEMSGNGRYVVFVADESIASGDTGRLDVYLYDRVTDTTTWVSEAPAGASEPDRGSRSPCITDDGSYIFFYSGKDFVASDTNGYPDLYMYDQQSDTYSMLNIYVGDASSADWNDIEDFAVSGDGTRIGFDSNEDVHGVGVNDRQVFVLQIAGFFTPGASRVAGTDRYRTSVEVSKEAFDSADTVVIATGENWPDALGGSALAGAVGGPLLLTRTGDLPGEVRAEIQRLGAQNAYILGGYNAVTFAVEKELEGLLPGWVNRVWGGDRYSTSQEIADKVIAVSDHWDGTVMYATGADFADALSAAPLAAGLDWPIVLVDPADGATYIPDNTQQAVIVGGTKAVPQSTYELLRFSPWLSNDDITRIAGPDRYATGAALAQFGVDSGLLWDGVGIASGMNFPDGLSGGVAVGMERSVLLLTPYGTLHPSPKQALTDNKGDITACRFLGGTAAVSTTVENQVKSVLGF